MASPLIASAARVAKRDAASAPSVRQNILGDEGSDMLGSADPLMKKVQAGAAANIIFWFAIAFYIPQLCLWVLGLSAIALNTIPIVNWIVPGREIYVITWFLIAAIGFCTMVYAIVVFMMRSIDCFGGWKGIIFIMSIVGYMVMILNLFPWFIVWIFSVVMLQGEGE